MSDQEFKASIERLTKPAEEGDIDAQYKLGFCFDRKSPGAYNMPKATEWFAKAAEQGHAAAQYELGWRFLEGKTVSQSYVKAVEWFTKAAEQGYVSAQYELGCCFYYGKGLESEENNYVPKNERKAEEWFIKAAEQGDSLAKSMLLLLKPKTNAAAKAAWKIAWEPGRLAAEQIIQDILNKRSV